MRFMKSIPAWMAVGLLVFALACGGGGDAGEESGDGGAPEAEAAGGGDFVTVDPAKAATVTGKVKLDGDAPKMPAINMSACGRSGCR